MSKPRSPTISSSRCARSSRCRKTRSGHGGSPATRIRRSSSPYARRSNSPLSRANGLERKMGTLTPGKDADIILLRTDRLNVMPMNNAVGAVVTSMGPQNVDTVLIAGKVMKRNGQLVGVDFGRLVRLGDEARD